MASFWLAGSVFLALLTLQIWAAEDEKSFKARLETCGGWRLNRLPEVKAFINDDAEKYPDLKVEYIGGIDPRMLFLENGEEKERVDIAEKSRAEINEMLKSHGLTMREDDSNSIEEDIKQDEPEKPNEKIEF